MFHVHLGRMYIVLLFGGIYMYMYICIYVCVCVYIYIYALKRRASLEFIDVSVSDIS